MILNTTYVDKEKRYAIKKIVGSGSPFWKAIFQKPVGSHRMIIEEYSNEFANYIKTNNSLLYGNLESRKCGIILRISINYETISWLIPYYKLCIYNSKNLSIHSEGQFIKFRKDSNYFMNKKFILSIVNKKSI